jgi:mono/diheme cytochrome c family protein
MQRILPYIILLLAVALGCAAVVLFLRAAPRGTAADAYQPRLDFNPPPPEPPAWATGDFNTYLARLHQATTTNAHSLLLDADAQALAEQDFRNTPAVPSDTSLEMHTPFFIIDPTKIFSLYHDLPALQRGLSLYQQHCASCHGVYGRGNGPAVRHWYTGNYPRNFWYGQYASRSTPLGKVPTDADLFRTLTRGFYGTAMPSYRHLERRDRWSLIQFLKSLANYYDEGQNTVYNLFDSDPEFLGAPPEPFEIGPEPPATPESVARGKTLFTKNGCVTCHQGNQPQPIGLYSGSGNGNLNWKDEMYRPVRHSRDLTTGIYHTGSAPSDVFRFMTAGSEIGPMPDAAQIPPDERWDIVHYLRSLFPAH